MKRVTSNSGKKTPGVDKVLWNSAKKKIKGVFSLRNRGYKASPLRRVYIKKKNGKLRPLGIPTMRDRAMQALHALALKPVAETTGDPNSYGFRHYRSSKDAIAQCFNSLAKKYSPKWILEADIKGCFDNISHKWLLENVTTNKKILSSWLKSGVSENGKRLPTTIGTPQGGIISPLLANITLDRLEREVRSVANCKSKLNVIRCADDFIITGKSRELLEEKVIPKVKEFLSLRGLSLSEEKTKIAHIDEGFDFLGQNCRKYKGKLLIRPSKSSVNTVVDKLRFTFKDTRGTNLYGLIKKLNPIIRGWANYHRCICSGDVFSKVDSYIFWNVLKWIRRGNGGKSYKWAIKRYVRKVDGINRFVVPLKRSGKTYVTTLSRVFDVKIRRHVKIRANANPFLEEWADYFDHRVRSDNLLNV